MFIAFDTPAQGTIADAKTGHGSYEAVRALLIQCAAVNCPVSLGVLADRKLIIERVNTDGVPLLSSSYSVPNTGGNDRGLSFDIDVAILPKAAVRVRFDDCGPGETQWVIINYEFQAVR